MREIIEMADGNLMGVTFDDDAFYDITVESYYDWLNAVEYNGVGYLSELSDAELKHINSKMVFTES